MRFALITLALIVSALTPAQAPGMETDMQSRRPTAIAVAQEIDSTDAPLYAATGTNSPIPDVSLIGDTWTPFKPARGAVQQVGEPVLLETDYEAGDYHETPNEGDTLDASGQRQAFRAGPGNIQLHPHSVPTFGGSWASHYDLAWVKLLQSGCLRRDAISTRSLTATGSTDANEWTVAAVPADVHVGQVITRTDRGRKYSSMVTGLDAGIVRQLVPLGQDLVNENVVEFCQTFEFGKPTAGRTLGNSVALRLDGAGWREYALGGRWSELVFSMSKRAVMAAFTMQFDLVIDASDDAAVAAGTNTDAIAYEPPSRRIFTWGGTRPQLSTAPTFDRTVAVSAPVMVAGEVLYVDEVTIKLTNTLGRRGDFDGLGPGPQEVDGVTTEVSLMLSRATANLDTLRRRLWNAHNNHHAVTLPMGLEGQHGGAWIIPGAILKNDVRRYDSAKDFYRVPLVFGVGPNVTENGGSTGPIKLGLA